MIRRETNPDAETVRLQHSLLRQRVLEFARSAPPSHRSQFAWVGAQLDDIVRLVKDTLRLTAGSSLAVFD
jgi:hypothetical protein